MQAEQAARVSRAAKPSVNGWSATMRLTQSDANAYAAIAGSGNASRRSRPGASSTSPGRSKSCRRASSSASRTTTDASVPSFNPCSTCKAVESAATDRDLPGATPPAREAAGRDEQRDGDKDAGGMRERPDGVRRE